MHKVCLYVSRCNDIIMVNQLSRALANFQKNSESPIGKRFTLLGELPTFYLFLEQIVCREYNPRLNHGTIYIIH